MNNRIQMDMFNRYYPAKYEGHPDPINSIEPPYIPSLYSLAMSKLINYQIDTTDTFPDHKDDPRCLLNVYCPRLIRDDIYLQLDLNIQYINKIYEYISSCSLPKRFLKIEKLIEEIKNDISLYSISDKLFLEFEILVDIYNEFLQDSFLD